MVESPAPPRVIVTAREAADKRRDLPFDTRRHLAVLLRMAHWRAQLAVLSPNPLHAYGAGEAFGLAYAHAIARSCSDPRFPVSSTVQQVGRIGDRLRNRIEGVALA